MPELYNCYIDESGDEGFKVVSKSWFFLSGVIVREKDDPIVRASVDELKQKLWRDTRQKPPECIHWKKLDQARRLAVSRHLSTKPFRLVIVGVCKRKLSNPNALIESDYFFRYCSKFLLERITWFVKDNHGRVKITFSNRTRFDIHLLRSCILTIQNKDNNEIKSVFDIEDIRVNTPANLRSLQIADWCASAAGNAFNPDDRGNLHSSYLNNLSRRFYGRNGNLFSYGLKLFPDSCPCGEYPFLFDL